MNKNHLFFFLFSMASILILWIISGYTGYRDWTESATVIPILWTLFFAVLFHASKLPESGVVASITTLVVFSIWHAERDILLYTTASFYGAGFLSYIALVFTPRRVFPAPLVQYLTPYSPEAKKFDIKVLIAYLILILANIGILIYEEYTGFFGWGILIIVIPSLALAILGIALFGKYPMGFVVGLASGGGFWFLLVNMRRDAFLPKIMNSFFGTDEGLFLFVPFFFLMGMLGYGACMRWREKGMLSLEYKSEQ